jgi:type IX secretion system PorP/SprF family membrane protein
MRTRFIALSITLCLIQAARGQQDIQFSQYAFNGLSLNPAYAGYKGVPYLNSTFRDQWVGFSGAPKTAMLSFDDITGSDEKMGLGAQVLYDQLGPQTNFSFTASYAYKILLNSDENDPHRLSIGIGGVISQYSLNGTVLQYADPGDPEAPAVDVHSKIIPDANFGIYYYTNHYYVGGSLMNLFSLTSSRPIYFANGSTYANLLQNTNMYLTAGAMTDLSDEIKFKPSIMVKEDFRGPTNVDFNAFLLFDEILWVGGSYRTSMRLLNQANLQSNLQATDAASVMIEFYATPELRIGYAYDFTTSGLSTYQSGSHELSIGLTFKTRKDRHFMANPRYF